MKTCHLGLIKDLNLETDTKGTTFLLMQIFWLYVRLEDVHTECLPETSEKTAPRLFKLQTESVMVIFIHKKQN